MADPAPVFIDTSCLVAHALGETGSRRVQALMMRASRRYASGLAEAELMATLRREGFGADYGAVPGLEWISPSRRLTPELARVLAAGYVRGADAWHIACALLIDPSAKELTFLTLDERQREVAVALGFKTR